MSEDWSAREDVSEELEESHGWTPDGDDLAWHKNGARWSVTLTDSRVTDPEGAYILKFDTVVPVHVIVAACEQVAALCQRCGTGCEGDHAPDATVNGEVV
ncbi:hypothetical protein ACFV16_22470 [Streptomyces massasporeus]|uniref:hypothetical protein n=1 Tax=Streptomyces massasporeus TaxID=67324 RepID=UPI0036A86A15